MDEQTGKLVIEGLGKLSEPVQKLLSMVEGAVGKVWEPIQITRVATAEAKAAIIEANSQVQVTDIQRRAIQRWIREEEVAQHNIESITQKAAKKVADAGTCGDIEVEWIRKFFAASRSVSNEQLQELWATLFANEATVPGTVSPATIDALSRATKHDLQLLRILAQFCWRLYLNDKSEPSRHVVFYPELAAIAGLISGGAPAFVQLQNLGAIVTNDMPSMLTGWKTDGVFAAYYGVWLHMHPTAGNFLNAGKVHLTRVGNDLLNLVPCIPSQEVFSATRRYWENHGAGSRVLAEPMCANPDKEQFRPALGT